MAFLHAWSCKIVMDMVSLLNYHWVPKLAHVGIFVASCLKMIYLQPGEQHYFFMNIYSVIQVIWLTDWVNQQFFYVSVSICLHLCLSSRRQTCAFRTSSWLGSSCSSEATSTSWRSSRRVTFIAGCLMTPPSALRSGMSCLTCCVNARSPRASASLPHCDSSALPRWTLTHADSHSASGWLIELQSRSRV